MVVKCSIPSEMLTLDEHLQAYCSSIVEAFPCYDCGYMMGSLIERILLQIRVASSECSKTGILERSSSLLTINYSIMHFLFRLLYSFLRNKMKLYFRYFYRSDEQKSIFSHKIPTKCYLSQTLSVKQRQIPMQVNSAISTDFEAKYCQYPQKSQDSL